MTPPELAWRLTVLLEPYVPETSLELHPVGATLCRAYGRDIDQVEDASADHPEVMALAAVLLAGEPVVNQFGAELWEDGIRLSREAAEALRHLTVVESR